eukprot:gene8303-1575_t
MPRVVVAQSSQNDMQVTRRMGLVALTASAAAMVAQPVFAFSSGFPGYDMNYEARKRSEDRNKREIQAEVEKG